MTAIKPQKELTPTELADILESNKYEKTQGMLKDEVGYCCLGVYAAECGFLQVDEVDGEGYVDDGNGTSTGGLATMAPAWMNEWVPGPNEAARDIQGQLIYINDSSQTFEPVIDFLRSL